MTDRPTTPNNLEKPTQPMIESRWPVLMAMLIAGAVYASLPEELSLGPRWLLLIMIVALALPSMLTHWRGNHHANNMVGYFTNSIVTAFLLGSVILLVRSLPSRKISPAELLRAAAALWVCNVMLFALWYWRLDAGGPYARHHRGDHRQGAFLFPPMTADGRAAVGEFWSPRFFDYLFLSFNTSTAFSPTDAPVLSRWAKLLVMLQSTISLTIVIILAARAVNLL